MDGDGVQFHGHFWRQRGHHVIRCVRGVHLSMGLEKRRCMTQTHQVIIILIFYVYNLYKYYIVMRCYDHFVIDFLVILYDP